MSAVLELELDSAAATAEVAAALGRVAQAGDCLGLTGDLGAGKTAFVQGLGHGLGIPEGEPITSPTFTLMNEYAGGRLPLIHADLYRIEKDAELDQLGLYEAIDSGSVIAIEWSDKFPVLPPDHLRIELAVLGPERRRLLGLPQGPSSVTILQRWRQELGT